MQFSKNIKASKCNCTSNELGRQNPEPARIHYLHTTPNLLHLPHSVHISNRQHIVYQYTTEHVIHPLIFLLYYDIPVSQSPPAAPAILARSRPPSIQTSNSPGKTTEIAPYPSRVHHSVLSSAVRDLCASPLPHVML